MFIRVQEADVSGERHDKLVNPAKISTIFRARGRQYCQSVINLEGSIKIEVVQSLEELEVMLNRKEG